jgi:hypothetical protein
MKLILMGDQMLCVTQLKIENPYRVFISLHSPLLRNQRPR